MMTWTATRTTLAAAVFLGVPAMGGCAARSASGQPPASAATSTNSAPPVTAPAVADDDEAASGLMEYHRYHHGGITRFIAMSIETLGVSPDQRVAIEKIRADLRVEMEPTRAAEQNLLIALADGLSGPSFDTTKVNVAITQVGQAAAAQHDAVAASLNQLHDVLTPAQRAALVDKVESHVAVWQEENSEEAGPTVRVDRGHLATLTKELELTTDQVDRIRAALADNMKDVPRMDRRQTAAHLRAFGDAFRRETFDAKALTTSTSINVQLMGWGAAHLSHLVETMGPILTPDQRAKLAQKLREHTTHASGEEGHS